MVQQDIYTMSKEETAYAEALNLLEPEPSSGPAGVGVVATLTAPRPDISALRERLAVLVSTGKAKEAIGLQLTHEQVKRLYDKDVGKYYKRYETYEGAKTTDSLIDSDRNVRQSRRHGSLPKRAPRRLHHQQRALQLRRQPCFEVLAGPCSGQCGSDHNKTH